MYFLAQNEPIIVKLSVSLRRLKNVKIWIYQEKGPISECSAS